jgi:histidinol-phosphatase (PHP family)
MGAFQKEMARLKAAYAERLTVWTGLEYDLVSEPEFAGFDYVIASVHAIDCAGKRWAVDHTRERAQHMIDEAFRGDRDAAAAHYFSLVQSIADIPEADIVGHFDLITKLCEKTFLFDADSKEYRAYALEAVDALVKKIPIAEINTGAIARGNRTSPYPAPWILKAWREKGGKIVISSDCHNNLYLAHAFCDAIALARECGYRETQVLTRDGFLPVSLEDMRKKLI